MTTEAMTTSTTRYQAKYALDDIPAITGDNIGIGLGTSQPLIPGWVKILGVVVTFMLLGAAAMYFVKAFNKPAQEVKKWKRA